MSHREVKKLLDLAPKSLDDFGKGFIAGALDKAYLIGALYGIIIGAVSVSILILWRSLLCQ